MLFTHLCLLYGVDGKKLIIKISSLGHHFILSTNNRDVSFCCLANWKLERKKAVHIEQIILSHLLKPVRDVTLHANRLLDNYDEVIWLIGDGRSGTTWVSDLLNHDKKYREMFEPFHPQHVDEMSFLSPHEYVRADDSHDQLKHIAADVFSGTFTHPVVDSANHSHLYSGLLIKDIFANLFAYWASIRFPNLKIILLIRNPFSVALSKSKKKDWYWVTDPMLLLNQRKLYEDYLHPFEELIKKTSENNDYILRQILIWSIINYVPLRQFPSNKIHIAFYEEVFADTNNQISSAFRFVKNTRENCHVELDDETIKRPSRVVSKDSSLFQDKSPVTSWKNEFSPKQIDAGLNILDEFGLAELYDDNSLPNRKVLNTIQGL